MQLLAANNYLLEDIKASIANHLPIENIDAFRTCCITDKVRIKVLHALLAYTDRIPHPGEVAPTTINDHKTMLTTLSRWQILSYISGIDLTIAKWFESHLDALSILHEIDHDTPVQGLWAVWAAEGHPNPIKYQSGKVSGTKTWCSGAGIVDYALITYRDTTGHAQLLIVDMQQDGITINTDDWQAVGMQSTATATVVFNQVAANKVGAADVYLDRVGFWHGAAGVATCWYGATVSLATYLVRSYQQKPNDFKAMYLGDVSTALAVSHQYIYHVAKTIDTAPTLSHTLAIRQLRANVEQLARMVLDTIGQALGATPFCLNAHFARLAADLTVFIRQSHGAFDLQQIGKLTSDLSTKPRIQSRQLADSLWQL